MLVKLSEMLGRMLRKRSIATLKSVNGLLQLRVLRLSLFQDGDVGVGVFPQREEILIRGVGLRRIALQGIGAGAAEMRERTDGFHDHKAAMVEELLELSSGLSRVMRPKIRFPTHEGRIQTE